MNAQPAWRREVTRLHITAVLTTVLALHQLACDRPAPVARESARAQASVPAYLQPLFHSLDSLLTGQQRDSLRHLSLDSGFTFRAWHLDEGAAPFEAEWMRSPIGDSILAHGEKAYMTSEVVLDLYHQHLRGEPLDLAGALHRVSPEYVDSVLPHTISVDSVLLAKDLDGNGVSDQLVREARRRALEVDVNNPGGAAGIDTVAYAEYRLALYLNAAPSRSQMPAWVASLDDISDGELIRAIDRGGGGALLVIGLGGADADVTVILLVTHGQVREILRHQVDYGEGIFDVRDKDGRVVVMATYTVQLGGRDVDPTIECPRQQWPASTLVYDDAAKQFVVERPICVPRL